MNLSINEQSVFEDAIDAPIIARYEGDLDRLEDERGKFNDMYIPRDTSQIRELLTEMWDGYLSVNAIEEAFCRLAEIGAEYWPYGWCDDDITEEEEIRQARSLNTAAEETNRVA